MPACLPACWLCVCGTVTVIDVCIHTQRETDGVACDLFARSVIARVMRRRRRRHCRCRCFGMYKRSTFSDVHWIVSVLTLSVSRQSSSAGVCVSVEFWTFNNKFRCVDRCSPAHSIVFADDFCSFADLRINSRKKCVNSSIQPNRKQKLWKNLKIFQQWFF